MPVITVENLSKKYIIHHQKRENYTALRDVIGTKCKNIAKKIRHPLTLASRNQSIEEFWALQHIDITINQGDRLGIIGRNGAGKSTLLKILSRITDPTWGRVRIKGRVASLLEVGTGFHPELTGRENIFLNGAILGMSKFEIKIKFDEIVAFAGVEKFLDTPVKRYSSGMYVRLAFAVAAHIEPEILLIDEVLAVGDSEFQKKCIGKLENFSSEGRTVVFVSHNMSAIKTLCTHAVLIEKGEVNSSGKVNIIIDKYLSQNNDAEENGCIFWQDTAGPSCKEIIISSIQLLDNNKKTMGVFYSSKSITVQIHFELLLPVKGARFVLSILTSTGILVVSTTNQANLSKIDLVPGSYITECIIPPNLLNAGKYLLSIHVGIPQVKVLIEDKIYLSFMIDNVDKQHEEFIYEKRPGIIAPNLVWNTKYV